MRDTFDWFHAPGAAAMGPDAHTRLLACIKRRDAGGAHMVMMEHLRDSEAMVAAALRREERKTAQTDQGTDDHTPQP